MLFPAPLVLNDRPQVRELGKPAQLVAGLATVPDQNRGITCASRCIDNRNLAPSDFARHLDDLLYREALAIPQIEELRRTAAE